MDRHGRAAPDAFGHGHESIHAHDFRLEDVQLHDDCDWKCFACYRFGVDDVHRHCVIRRDALSNCIVDGFPFCTSKHLCHGEPCSLQIIHCIGVRHTVRQPLCEPKGTNRNRQPLGNSHGQPPPYTNWDGLGPCQPLEFGEPVAVAIRRPKSLSFDNGNPLSVRQGLWHT